VRVKGQKKCIERKKGSWGEGKQVAKDSGVGRCPRSSRKAKGQLKGGRGGILGTMKTLLAMTDMTARPCCLRGCGDWDGSKDTSDVSSK